MSKAATGRNVLIGGEGSDHLKAGPRGDILVAGWTDYDADMGALRAILQQWAAPDVDYSDRVARISGLQCGNEQRRGVHAGPRPSHPRSRQFAGRSQPRLVPGPSRSLRRR